MKSEEIQDLRKLLDDVSDIDTALAILTNGVCHILASSYMPPIKNNGAGTRMMGDIKEQHVYLPVEIARDALNHTRRRLVRRMENYGIQQPPKLDLTGDDDEDDNDQSRVHRQIEALRR